DTIGYVRGPDVAVMKLAGPRFATAWAKFDPGSVDQRRTPAPAGARVASYNDNEVLAGRSIYYGVLAYLGALTGGFWLTVFVQGLGVAWLAEIILRALRIVSLRAYAGVIALLALATPAPFFVSFLMPDIWVGVGIGAAASLFALSGRLKALDGVALAAMTAFAAMAHTSFAPVLLALAAVGGGWRLVSRGAPSPGPGLAACALALACAVGGDFAFTKMVEHTAGRPPVMPPFLTARVVADGPGTRYAQERCGGQFVACRFADRFPMGVDDFLWGQGRQGVFEAASSAERRALGDEQARFALAAVRAYPLQQAAASARNAALQTVDTDLSDFNYKPSLRASLTSRVPPAVAARLRRTLAFREGWPLAPFWTAQSAVLLASLVAAAWLAGRPRAVGVGDDASRAVLLFGLILVGVLANGVVCGVLSTLYGRYEARVVWTLPLAAAALAAALSPLRARSPLRALQPARA
ncbi:MAG: hypothetical protein P4L73_04080, partial [Caulobacteraceae bacterium]|nr:hypothetical protein [Caulobacteraceae bacterium]